MPSNEEKGLIRSQRLPNGYRVYDESVVKQVQTIQLYFHLGLNTEQIKTIVDCDPFRFPHEQLLCDEVLRLYQNKLDEVSQQSKTLEEVKSRLMKRIAEVKLRRHAQERGKENGAHR